MPDRRPADLDALLAEVAALRGRTELLEGRLLEQADRLGAVWASVHGMVEREEHERALAAIYDLHDALAERSGRANKEQRAYRELVRRVREEVRRTLPAGATVAVVSKGDDQLLSLYGRTAWHFPRGADGAYAGYHPPSSLAAIVQLEALRSEGADFLLVPSTSLWWLDHYVGLRDHLARHYRLLTRREDTAAIYALRERPEADRRQDVASVVAEFQRRFDRQPALLDCWTGLDLAPIAASAVLFWPPSRERLLPYVDRSVDVVVLRTDGPVLAAEAHRVAAAAVVSVTAAADRPPHVSVEWLSDGPAGPLPTASVVVVSRDPTRTGACLAAIVQAFEGNVDVEVVLAVESGAEPPTPAGPPAEGRPRIVVASAPARAGLAARCSQAAGLATGEILVLLDDAVMPQPGWLAALLRTFRDNPGAGVAGGMLVHPDGRLGEAGTVVCADGSLVRFGESSLDLDSPLFNYLREVDGFSGGLLATPTRLFTELGGLAPALVEGSYAAIDYCLRVRRAGRRVLYQPESVALLRPAPADPADGDCLARARVAFVAAWRGNLDGRPPPVREHDTVTWYALLGGGRA
jgi:hypothetical protein